ncbi:YlbF family regulator [Sedimentibacter sp. zth1]|uniref:YlbF family regulator n=1 Tax=Sedimentibacter sp. zth1 TaxID=2816908 RepID=UPI001A92E7B2|nr:YlbF family regulator [Sedimentibacter sp. zth1]QSX06289.1 YlbF family regulator [Sedimentibacter sp. zth1]
MELKKSVQTFSNAIKSTKEFSDLIQAKRAIEKNNMLKNEVIDFNQKLSSIYSSNKPQNIIKSEAEQLFKKFDSLNKNIEVEKFLKASDEFNKMMYRTNQYMNELVQKELILK